MSEMGIPQRLRDLADRARVPRGSSEEGLRERFGDPADVDIQVGQVWRAQVWRAQWEDISLLVLIVVLRTAM